MEKIPSTLFGSKKLLYKAGNMEFCFYVLDNGVRILSKGSFQKALGFDGKSEEWLHAFLDDIIRLKPALQPENNLFATYQTGGKISEGILSDQIINLCNIIIEANKNGLLSVSQVKYAKAAAIISTSLSERDTDAIIDESTGFRNYKTHLKDSLRDFMVAAADEPAAQWVSALPDRFFEMLFQMKFWNWDYMGSHPGMVANTLHEILFSRLNVVLVENLRHQKPKRTYRVKSKPRNTMHPALGKFLAEINEIGTIANGNWNIFMQLLNRAYAKNGGMEIDFTTVPGHITEPPELSEFERKLALVLQRPAKK